MGWINYIIIQDFKLLIEISRHVNELDDYVKESLNFLIDDECYDTIETNEIKITNLTIKDLSILVLNYDKSSSLKDLNFDSILLYWLKCRGINYEIKSEYNVNIKDYEQMGYQIIRRN